MPTITHALGLSIAAAALLASGCARQHTNGAAAFSLGDAERAANTQASATAELYLYYPDAEIYYAPDRNLYFWPSAAFWNVGQRLPSNYGLGTSPAPLLLLETDKPYRVHAQIAAAFPARRISGSAASASSIALAGAH